MRPHIAYALCKIFPYAYSNPHFKTLVGSMINMTVREDDDEETSQKIIIPHATSASHPFRAELRFQLEDPECYIEY
jgi:hypothetical protein